MRADRRIALATLLDRLGAPLVVGPRSGTIESIEADSRRVRAGALFIAVRGSTTDGHRYVHQAVENGARAVVIEGDPPWDLADNVTVACVPDSRRALSALAAAFYGDPSHDLDVIGITGTNGKTTTAHMIAAICDTGGIACGLIGTIGAQFESHRWRLENTTPLPPVLHEIIACMRDAGAKAVAMEVSSHALALDRVDDVQFRIAVLTNVARDHLDFHETLEAYAAAKRRLFSLASVDVLNADDVHGVRWAQELRHERREVVLYGTRSQASLVAGSIVATADRTTFTVNGQRFELRIPGRFNVWNALAAVGVARTMGIDDAVSARALQSIERVAGRMERFSAANVAVVVDYAHTPDALENALNALRETAAGALAVVFGCGGDRDRGKRPQMGAIAARLADRIYVTSDNPRTEAPQAIADAIVSGIGNHPHVVELDRRLAIERAVAQAHPGDVVLVAGKGHESYQIVGDRVLPFDDADVAREALAARGVLR